jgi:hypothetical protein
MLHGIQFMMFYVQIESKTTTNPITYKHFKIDIANLILQKQHFGISPCITTKGKSFKFISVFHRLLP